MLSTTSWKITKRKPHCIQWHDVQTTCHHLQYGHILSILSHWVLAWKHFTLLIRLQIAYGHKKWSKEITTCTIIFLSLWVTFKQFPIIHLIVDYLVCGNAWKHRSKLHNIMCIRYLGGQTAVKMLHSTAFQVLRYYKFQMWWYTSMDHFKAVWTRQKNCPSVVPSFTTPNTTPIRSTVGLEVKFHAVQISNTTWRWVVSFMLQLLLLLVKEPLVPNKKETEQASCCLDIVVKRENPASARK